MNDEPTGEESTLVDTPKQSQDIYNHLIDNVLVQHPDSSLCKALEYMEIDSLSDLMSMTEQGIESLPMLLGTRVCLCAFKAFLHHLGPNVDFFTITYDDFQ